MVDAAGGKIEATAELRRRGADVAGAEGTASRPVPAPDPAARAGNPPATARVRYAEGVTINMGKFESARIDVAIELPARASSDSIAMTLDFARDTVEEYLAAEVAKVVGARDEGADAVALAVSRVGK